MNESRSTAARNIVGTQWDNSPMNKIPMRPAPGQILNETRAWIPADGFAPANRPPGFTVLRYYLDGFTARRLHGSP